MKRAIFMAVAFVLTLNLAAQLKINDKAPNFNLKNIDGKMVQLADYQSKKGVVVVFTCNHCPYAKMYEARIQKIHDKYSPLDVPVVAINPNDSIISPEDSYSKMIRNSVEKKFTFPYILDDQEIFKQYGATRTPHIFLLKKERNDFIVTYIGAIDDNPENADDVKEHYLTDAIDALLANKKPKIATTKSVGCTIKTK